jgi:hypothetical protein
MNDTTMTIAGNLVDLQLIDPAGRQAEALAQHVQPVLVIKAEQHSAEIDQQDLGAITIHGSTVAARETAGWPRPRGRITGVGPGQACQNAMPVLHRMLVRPVTMGAISAATCAGAQRLRLLSVTGFHVSLRFRLAQFPRHGRIRAPARQPGAIARGHEADGEGGFGLARHLQPGACSRMEHVWRLG